MTHKPLGERFKQPGRLSRRDVGFTLTELLIVIAIIIVLAAASFPMMRKVRESAKGTTCASNVRQMGMALIMYANENGQKLMPLQPSTSPDTGKRPPIWPVHLARAGYLWDGEGELPCGRGVWTCPSCDFMSNAYGGYGVVEGEVFVYEENRPVGVKEEGSLRLLKIDRPASTWLIGDAAQKPDELNKGWYAIWAKPDRWGSHCPAERHRGKANVCMVDGHVEALSMAELEEREITFDVLREDD